MLRQLILVAVMFVFVSTSVSAADPIPGQWTETAGLIAHWELDEVAGLTASDSVDGHDGALMNFGGDNSQWVTGQINGALEFDGNNDYVDVTGYKGIADSNPRTVAAWIKTSTTGEIVSWGTSSTGAKWIFRVQDTNGTDGAIRVEVSGGYIVGKTDVRDNAWHHVAAVLEEGDFDVSDVKLYVDGVEETPYSSVSPEPIYTAVGADVKIGVFIGSNRYFSGQIDDVRIYNRALSPIKVITTNLSVSENGVSDIYSVSLWNIPSGTVTLKVYDTSDPNPDDADGVTSGELKFDGADSKVLTFTTENWDTPQNVTVTAIDDPLIEINPHITSIGAVASQTAGSAEYDGIKDTFCEVTILENDCGMGPFSSMDFNQDCIVDFVDFIKFTEVWLDCSVDDSLGECPEPPSLPEGVKFRFGVAADIHHTTVPHALAPWISDKSVEIENFATEMTINLAGFIIGVGDNVHEGYNGGVGSRYSNEIFTANVTTFKNSMITFVGDVYHVLGNHDVLGTLDMDGLRAIWDDPDAKSHMPAGYYSFDYPGKDLRFIVLDAQYRSDGSHYEPMDIGYAVGHIPPVEQSWLSGELEEARNLGYEVFIFCHQQISDDSVYGLAPVSNYTEVVTILNSYNDIIRIVFGGHDHSGYMYLRNGINYVHITAMQDGVSWALVELRDDDSIFVDGHGNMPDFNIP